MNAGGIPCGPVYGIDQAFNDPQVKHLGIAKKVPSRALGDITLIGQPVNLSRTKTTMVTGAPEYAEQADEILARVRLRQQGHRIVPQERRDLRSRFHGFRLHRRADDAARQRAQADG